MTACTRAHLVQAPRNCFLPSAYCPPGSCPMQGPVPGVPSGGLHVMAQIAEEGSSSQDKRKQSGEGCVDIAMPWQ